MSGMGALRIREPLPHALYGDPSVGEEVNVEISEPHALVRRRQCPGSI